MPVDQDWTQVWPTAATFNPSVVPLPIRQGFVKNSSENEGVKPHKYHNMELMKIPNFLHLTPKHIKKHCAAIKKFCTKWPEGINSDEECDKHFPLSFTTHDYIQSGPSLRDPRARIVKLKFPLSCLELDDHARDKIIRLLGDRFNQQTGEVTIITDSCPLKTQNMEYARYLLTALYYESWKVEPWEAEMTWADLRSYEWEKSFSKKRLEELTKDLPSLSSSESKEQRMKEYGNAVAALHNKGESRKTLDKYKNAVLNLLES